MSDHSVGCDFLIQSMPHGYQALIQSLPHGYQALIQSMPHGYQALMQSMPHAYQALIQCPKSRSWFNASWSRCLDSMSFRWIQCPFIVNHWIKISDVRTLVIDMIGFIIWKVIVLWRPVRLSRKTEGRIYVSKLITLGSDNGLSPGRWQAWTNAGILLIGPLGTNFNEILIEIHTFSFEKMHLKMSSAKWRLFCLGLNELMMLMSMVYERWQWWLHAPRAKEYLEAANRSLSEGDLIHGYIFLERMTQ